MKSKAQELERKLIQVFSKEPEVWKIQVFGRLIEGADDEYSDVDIKIISKDPYLTQQNYHNVIEKNICKIRKTFILASNENCFAEMIMLEDYSPYQKIDISIERDGFGVHFSPISIAFQNDFAKGLNRDCEAYEIKRTVEYDLSNFLFGIPRITKCFFRKDFDMYRRWKNWTDVLLVMLEEKYIGWQQVNDKEKVKAHDSKLLFQKITKDDREKLEKVLPLDGKIDIPKSFLSGLMLYIELSKDKAKTINVALDEEFIKYMMEFAKDEVKRLKQ